MRVLTLRLAAAALLAAAAGVGCEASGEATAPPQKTVTVTVSEPAPPPAPDDTYAVSEPVPAEAQTATFSGTYFSVEYPTDWDVETAEVSKGAYLDTTIRNSLDPDAMLRIDVRREASEIRQPLPRTWRRTSLTSRNIGV